MRDKKFMSDEEFKDPVGYWVKNHPMRDYGKKCQAVIMKFRAEKEAIRQAIEPEPEIVCSCGELIDFNDAEQVRYRTCGACLGREL